MVQDLAKIIDKLLSAMSGLDLDAMIDFYDDDMVFELVPEHASIHGKKTWRKNVNEFMQWVEEGKKEFIRSVQQGNTIWIERIDHWKIHGKWISLPIVAIVEFTESGKIKRWLEYHTLEYRKQFEAAPETGFGKK